MKAALYFAAFLAVAVGVAHSWLGERFILMRLFRRGAIPELFGSADFTIRTLRFAWHVTTVAWLGFAVLLIMLAHPPVSPRALGTVIGATFLAHFALAFAGSRGRHLSWLVFLAIGIIALAATRS